MRSQKAGHTDAILVLNKSREKTAFSGLFSTGDSVVTVKKYKVFSNANDSLIVSLEGQVDVAFLLHYNAVLLLQRTNES